MNRVVTIYPPMGFTRQGRRDNNEDYIVPAVGRATPADRLFVVCDGVGGAQRGELASLLAGETIVSYARQHPATAVDSTFVRTALLAVEEAFDRAIAEETDANLAGMSTTLTLLSLHEQGVTIAHIGDSRVYHIRDGQILHQTDDHSLVNELVRAGQISPDEVATHPRRNVITRAIQGSANPTQATVYVTQDLAADDYFFLCTDGVLESITNDDLTQMLQSHTLSDRQKIEIILDSCSARSRDNYSGYLIRVAEIEPIVQSVLPDDVVPIVLPQVQAPSVVPEPMNEPLMHHGKSDPQVGPSEPPPDSFQFTMDDEEEARWREQENRNWIKRLFS